MIHQWLRYIRWRLEDASVYAPSWLKRWYAWRQLEKRDRTTRA